MSGDEGQAVSPRMYQERVSSHADDGLESVEASRPNDALVLRRDYEALLAENQQLRAALERILDVPFDVNRSAYADASDIAEAALAAVRVEEA